MAIKTGQRPTAMILHDKYAGYRDWDNPYWDVEKAPYVNPQEWTDWDFTLASVSQLIEDYTNKANGQLFWIDESPDVDWEVRSAFSGYDAAIDREKKERDSLDDGESIYAVPIFKGDERPTIHQWLKMLEDNSAMPHGAKGGHQEWEIVDAISDRQDRRTALAEKLKRQYTTE